jgi:hypothetical protein
MRKPNTPPEKPDDTLDLDAPCELEEAKADFLRRLRNGAMRSVPEKHCRYVGVLTGRPCGVTVEIKNSELIIKGDKLIPCLEKGEFTAIDEHLPLSGPILEPIPILDLDVMNTAPAPTDTERGKPDQKPGQ